MLTSEMLALSCCVFVYLEWGMESQTINKHSKSTRHFILKLTFKKNSTQFSQMKCLLLPTFCVGIPGHLYADIIY